MPPLSQVVYLAVVEAAARPTLLAQYTPQLTAQSFANDVLTPLGLVELTLLTHPVFQTSKPDQIRDIRLSRIVSCQDRSRLLEATAQALLWYDTCLQGFALAPDLLHQQTVESLRVLDLAIKVHQRRPGDGPRADVLRRAWRTLRNMVVAIAPEDYRRFGNREKFWDRITSEARWVCADAIVTAFRQHGPAKGYPAQAIYHAVAAIMTTLVPSSAITAAAIQRASSRPHPPTLKLGGQPISLAQFPSILERLRSPLP